MKAICSMPELKMSQRGKRKDETDKRTIWEEQEEKTRGKRVTKKKEKKVYL